MARWVVGFTTAVLLLASSPAGAALPVPYPSQELCSPLGGDCPRAKKKLNFIRMFTDRGEVFDLIDQVAGGDIREVVQSWADGHWRLDVGKQRVYVEVRGRFDF